jgi:hypothetical protein
MKLIEEIEKIEKTLPNGFIEGYQFYVSKNFQCDIKEYKCIKINYINAMPLNAVYYAPNIYTNEN